MAKNKSSKEKTLFWSNFDKTATVGGSCPPVSLFPTPLQISNHENGLDKEKKYFIIIQNNKKLCCPDINAISILKLLF